MSTKLRLEGILSYADISRNLEPKIIWAKFLNSQSPNNPPVQKFQLIWVFSLKFFPWFLNYISADVS